MESLDRFCPPLPLKRVAVVWSGLLAVRMLAATDDALQTALIRYHDDMRQSVETAAASLESVGYAQYLADKTAGGSAAGGHR